MAVGKRYSAGAIFLQVVPVFANTQRAIEDHAEGINRALGDQMEKAGAKAGERAGKAATKAMADAVGRDSRVLSGAFEREMHKSVDGINRALEGIDVKRLSNELRKELASVKKELSGLKDLDLAVDLDRRKADVALAELEGRLLGLRDNAKIIYRVDIDNALKGIAKVKAARESIEDPIEMETRADFKPVERELGKFEKTFKKRVSAAAEHLGDSIDRQAQKVRAALKGLGDAEIGVDMSSDTALRQLAKIEQELEKLSRSSVDPDVRFNAAAALSEVVTYRRALESVDDAADRLDGRTVKVNIRTDGAENAVGLMSRLGLSGDRAANSFRSFNAVALGTAALGPALIPMLGAVAGALIAIAPAAAIGAAGLGSLLVGFSGIGDAVSALSNQHSSAAMTAQSAANAQVAAARAIANAEQALADARRNAARAAEDAAERVADAREQAAEAIEDALERQKDAQEAYRDSVQDVRDAEQALRDARREAADNGQEIDFALRQNELAIDQALLDSFDATVNYNALLADGSATNAEREQARIDMEEAKQRLEELRREQEELEKQKRKWERDGVNGSDEVKDAQEALNEALEAQKEAYEAMQDAAEAADEARADGAEAVRDALEAQNETLADNRRAIADAAQALRDARQAGAESAEQLNAQQAAVNDAFSKLGPAGRKFARFLFSMRDEFYAFRDDIQAVLLPAVQDAIESFMGSGNAEVARSALIGLADAYGRLARAFSKSLRGESWGKFFQMLNDYGPRITRIYGDSFILLMEAIAELLALAAPYAVDFAKGVRNIMQSFSDWAKSKEGADALANFMSYAQQVGPAVRDFIFAFAGGVSALVKALAPLGSQVLATLTDFFNFIAEMDPEMLRVIASATVAGVLIFQVISGMASLLLGLGAVLSPFGAIVFGVGLVAAAFIYLWKTSEGFRDFMIDAWDRISSSVSKAWKDSLQPALKDLWVALQDLWTQILQPFFEWLGPKLVVFAENYLPAMIRVWAAMIKGVAWAAKNVFIPAIRGIASALGWLWKNIWKPILGAIVKGWEAVAEVILWAWAKVIRPTWDRLRMGAKILWERYLKPAFERIRDGWRDAMAVIDWAWEKYGDPVFDYIRDKAIPRLKDAFATFVDRVKEIWNGMRKAVGAPIEFVINTVIRDGLVAGFNKVADFVGAGQINFPGVDWEFATGGVLPGYTPGKDVHHFVSPTGGRLHLSGGEAIMRPEFTAAVGTGFVDSMNAAARSGGIDGVRRAIFGEQAFAKGGVVFPVPKGWYIERTEYNLNHDGVDINHPNDSGPNGQGGSVPFVSATGGRVNYVGYGRGYGLATFIQSPYGELVYGHAFPGSARRKAGEDVVAGSYLGLIGTTGRSSGPHLHFGFPGGTFGGALSVIQGGRNWDAGEAKKMADPFAAFPDWLVAIAKNPLDFFQDRVVGALKGITGKFGDTGLVEMVSSAPLKLVSSVARKAFDIMPSALKAAVGGVKDVFEGGKNLVNDGLGLLGMGGRGVVHAGAVPDSPAGLSAEEAAFADGGILRYNGTMMYDNGGLLPPGLTSVVNLTGKPEPVFTSDQWAEFSGGRETGGSIHYEPHFEGSDLTANDVASDLNFAFRKLKRQGKYAGVGD